ncbi:MAG: porin [Leptothrix ochracea]
MKKSLLALAALSAIAGAASAQSSVTISGVIDVGLEKSTATALQMAASKMATSNLTFKGVEDLGNGWKAGFTLSHEFTGDNGDSGANAVTSTSTTTIPTGTVINGTATTAPITATTTTTTTTPNTAAAPAGGTGFGNFGSWVGLSNASYGSLDVGTVFTTTFKNHQTPNGTKGGSNSNAYKVLAFDACDPGAAGTAAATSCAHVFSRNTVQYNSPSIGGLSASLDVVFPETFVNTPNPTTTPEHGHTFGLKYVAGPVDVRTAVDRGLGKDKDLVLLSASVDLGAVKLFANFENGQVRASAAATKTSAYLVGLRAPIGAAGSIWAHIGTAAEASTYIDTTGGATVPSNVSVLGLGYQHKLSARTSLYGNYGTYKNGDSAKDKTDVGFGVAHTF